MRTIILALVASMLFVGCGNDKKKKPADKKPVEKTVKKEEAPKKEAKKEEATKAVSLTINGTDQMQFDKKELKVKAGQKVTLTLNHTGKMAKEAMGHNWVLLKKGVNMAEYATKAMAAKDKDYLINEGVIAHTKLIGGGESTSITFDAPEKGTYEFLCSFPGHYAMMKGKFIVE